jgi:hypothetical protein
MSRLTLEAEAAARKAALWVAMASAILNFLTFDLPTLLNGNGLKIQI